MNKVQLTEFNQLLEHIAYGQVDCSFQVHGKEIKSMEVYGNKTNIYNRSKNDTNNNKQAIEDIVNRVLEAIERRQKGVVSFSVVINENQQVKTVQWSSKKKKRYNLTND